MKKKIDLPEAIQKRMEGEKVTVVLDADIASLTLGVLMGLDDICADFLMDVPDDVSHAEPVWPAVPAITIEQMEGDILESPPPTNQKKRSLKEQSVSPLIPGR